MCSPHKDIPRLLLLCALCASLGAAARPSAAASAGDPEAPAASAAPPGPSAPPPAASAAPPAISAQRAQIEHGLALLRDDPNLGRASTVRRLHWDFEAKEQQRPDPATANWILNLFEYLTQIASLLVWIVGAVIAGFLAIWIWRLIQTRQLAVRRIDASATQHVQDLDIRPASLPSDIGAAALALLKAGNTRAALSLLYRGALSRAVHRFAVGIGESYTESEALRAVESRLDAPKSRYFAELVGIWQRTVYGAVEPAPTAVEELCKTFAGTFDAGAI